MTRTVICSKETSNTVAIAASSTGVFPMDFDPLETLGLKEREKFYNYALASLKSTATCSSIRLKIGKDSKIINKGDAFEWGADITPIIRTAPTVDNLDAANAMAIGDLTIQYARLA